MRTTFLAAIACFGTMSLSEIAIADGDIITGESTYSKKCLYCHLLETNKVGPYLTGVIGRPVATVEGFAYSEAMKAYAATGVVWDEETLDAFLRYPGGAVKGTTMLSDPVMNRADRADIIAFLKSKK